MIWIKLVFGGSCRRYESGKYLISYNRIMSSKPCYTLYLADEKRSYLSTHRTLAAAKKVAEQLDLASSQA